MDVSDQSSVVEKRGAKASAPKSAWPWAFAVVALGIVAAATFLSLKLIDAGRDAAMLPVRAIDRLGAIFKPNVTVSTVVMNTVEKLKKESKLVVLTVTVNVEVSKKSEKNSLYGLVDFGETTVTLKAYGNKVQYFVPLAGLKTDDIRYDPVSKKVIIFLPGPELDEGIVEVQSDPARMELRTDVGWARLDRFSGQFLRDEAKRDLRPAVIRAGKQQLIREKAERATIEALQPLLGPLSEQLQPGVGIEVRFEKPAGELILP